MDGSAFHDQPLALNAAVFCLAAIVVWLAGTRVARLADRFATRSGIAHATVGLVLLAGITSLPEVAIALTSALAGAPALAVNGLLGGVSLQIAILAIADAVFGRQALTVVAGTSAMLLQATMIVLLLLVLALGVVVGDVALAGAGAWSWSLLAGYVFAIRIISGAERRPLWMVRGEREAPPAEAGSEAPAATEAAEAETPRRLALRIGLAGAVILLAGVLLSLAGEAIARQTGLGNSFFGVVFLGLSASLPEFSTVLAAVKLRRYAMAIGDIFGTNLFNVALVLLVDLAYRGPPVLREVERITLVASLLGALLAGIYLAGLLERRNRTIARMGIDSFAVLLAYLGGLVLMYRLR